MWLAACYCYAGVAHYHALAPALLMPRNCMTAASAGFSTSQRHVELHSRATSMSPPRHCWQCSTGCLSLRRLGKPAVLASQARRSCTVDAVQ